MKKFLPALLLLLLLASCSKKAPDKTQYKNIEDFKGREVAVCVGSTYDRYMTEHYPDVPLFRISEPSYGVLPVKEEHVSALLLGGGLAKAVVRENPNLALLAEPVFVEPIAIGFHRAKLRDEFNQMLDTLNEDSLAMLVDKWVNDDGTASIKQIPHSDSNGIFKIGLAVAMPYGFVRDNEYCGLDIELLYRFAALHNMKPTVQLLGLSALLAALDADRVDAICGGLAITEDRASNVLFANSHTNSAATLVVLRKNAAPNAIAELEGVSRQENVDKEGDFWDAVQESFYNNLVKEKRYLLILHGMETTLYISLFAILLGSILCVFVCSMRLSRSKVLSIISRCYTVLLRGIPQVVLLMIMFYIVFVSSNLSGMTIATFTFAFYFAANVSEIFRTAILSIDKGQAEAGRVLGFSRAKTFFYIIFPQAFNRALPLYKNEIISLVKMTAIVGYVAVQDLTQAGDIIRSRTFEAFFPLIFIALLYFLLSYSLIFFLQILERRHATHHKN